MVRSTKLKFMAFLKSNYLHFNYIYLHNIVSCLSSVTKINIKYVSHKCIFSFS